MDSFQLTDKSSAESKALPAAKALLKDDKKETDKEPKAASEISKITADFFGGSRLCLLARRSVLIMAGEIRLRDNPIDAVIPPEGCEEPEEDEEKKEEEENSESAPEEEENPDGDGNGESDEDNEDDEGDDEDDNDEENDENVENDQNYRNDGENEIPEESSVILFDFLEEETPYENLREEEETAFEEILDTDEVERDWVREYFTNCKKPEIRPNETDGAYILRRARRICPTLGVRLSVGEIENSRGGTTIEPDALPAILLASAAALLGTTSPQITLSFSTEEGEPRVKLLLTSKKGMADTEFFNGIRHYAEMTGIYFATAPHPRGFFTEMCVARTELSLLGLKNRVGFSAQEKR